MPSRASCLVLGLFGLAFVIKVSTCVVADESLPASTRRLLPSDEPSPIGQWVWTRRDAVLLRDMPAVEPGVLALSIAYEGGALTARRGLSPAVTGQGAIALVVRLEDSLHGAWDALSAQQLAAQLGQHLTSLLAEAEDTGIEISELQLDYDAPIRRLGVWSQVLRRLKAGPLSKHALWLTSIPAHLGDERYGVRLRGIVAGHIIQLFDTGLACNDERATELLAQLRQHDLPYRYGVGAFERRRDGRALTEHGCWTRRSMKMRDARLYRGHWVFPAGQSYREQLALLAPSSAAQSRRLGTIE